MKELAAANGVGRSGSGNLAIIPGRAYKGCDLVAKPRPSAILALLVTPTGHGICAVQLFPAQCKEAVVGSAHVEHRHRGLAKFAALEATEEGPPSMRRMCPSAAMKRSRSGPKGDVRPERTCSLVQEASSQVAFCAYSQEQVQHMRPDIDQAR